MKYYDPIDYWVLDNFLDNNLAKKLSEEFFEYSDKNWFCYNNPLEHKKTINNWYFFPSTTYSFMSYLNSLAFVKFISNLTGIKQLYPDPGLHGAGWHIHGNGGKLNVHLDYSIHPKLKLQRKLNLILYLSEQWDPLWGGNLEFWSHDKESNKPIEKTAVVENIFNRAVIFDTTQNSWHGFPNPINCPDDQYRKSIAMYYLCDPPCDADQRFRALYAPSQQQINDPEIIEFIKIRSQ